MPLPEIALVKRNGQGKLKTEHFTLEVLMKLKALTQRVAEPVTKPVVEPSVPGPKADPLHDVRETIEAIRQDSAQAPREYLDDIRTVLGAE
jgi:hypothetical protein